MPIRPDPDLQHWCQVQLPKSGSAPPVPIWVESRLDSCRMRITRLKVSRWIHFPTSSDVEPDSTRSVDPNPESWPRKDKPAPKKGKILTKLNVFNSQMFSLGGLRIFLKLGSHSWRPKRNEKPCDRNNLFHCTFFLHGHKTWIWIRIHRLRKKST